MVAPHSVEGLVLGLPRSRIRSVQVVPATGVLGTLRAAVPASVFHVERMVLFGDDLSSRPTQEQ